MNKYVNRNFFWADLFVNQLSQHDISHVCISPGSRNTPLTMAFAKNKKFKKYIIIDERSNGFFALGLSKSIKKPVVIVTTSGTAVAELYPAIIEAYYQRIPLIVCTADRPAFLRDRGANQTINQNNIFRNHIRFFYDPGLPSLNESELRQFALNISKAVNICHFSDRGPIHFNFPFKKPLEPTTFSDKIDLNVKDFLIQGTHVEKDDPKQGLVELFFDLKKSVRPVIHCGWDNFNEEFYMNLLNFSLKHKIPCLSDGASDLRFLKRNNEAIIVNHSTFLPLLEAHPDLIIQFGNAPTSQSMLNYFEKTSAKRYLINKFGDIKDPSKTSGILLKTDPNRLLDYLLNTGLTHKWNKWLKRIITFDKLSESVKLLMKRSKFGSESRIITELIDLIPNNSNIFISNSLPIRDFDYFASKKKSNFKIFTNRGASGIDGIISTAAGISIESKLLTYLIIGDLAFCHNLGALSTLDQLGIPLKIILINNSGGNIFRMLPISENNDYFETYFITPQKIRYDKVVEAFNGIYYSSESWKSFRSVLKEISTIDSFSLVEIKTDPVHSVYLRKKYWSKVAQKIKLMNDTES